MKFGIALPFVGKFATPDNLIRVAKAADDLGYYFLTAGEHLVYPKHIAVPERYSSKGAMPMDVSDPHIDLFTCLSFVAAETTRIMLRAGVVVLPFRSPFVTARMAASLDYLTKGRLMLGVGVGWMREEYEVLKVPWGERAAITDEYIRVMRALFDGQPFKGKYYEFEAVDFAPKPVQRPLPILIGGTSAASVRRAARLGDGWIPTSLFPDEVAKYVELLRRHLAEEGRNEDLHVTGDLFVKFGDAPADTTERRVMVVANDCDQILEAVKEWRQAGAQSIYLRVGDNAHLPPEVTIERLQWFAEKVMRQAESI